MVACEHGSVTAIRSKVIVQQEEESDGKTTEKDFDDEGSGVKQEAPIRGQLAAFQ